MNTSPNMKEKGMSRMKNNYIIQAWLVLFLASGFGAALAGIQLNLSPKIEANKLNETLEKVPELVLGAAKAQQMAKDNQFLEIDRRTVVTGKGNIKKVYSVFQAKKDGQTVGWVAKASGQGYADKIELLVGVDAKVKKITGLFILDQKETPGLGSKIADWDWRKQFLDKKTEQQLIAVKSGASAPNEIDAITGATISSKFICDIINKSLSDLKEPLAEASEQGTSK